MVFLQCNQIVACFVEGTVKDLSPHFLKRIVNHYLFIRLKLHNVLRHGIPVVLMRYTLCDNCPLSANLDSSRLCTVNHNADGSMSMANTAVVIVNADDSARPHPTLLDCPGLAFFHLICLLGLPLTVFFLANLFLCRGLQSFKRSVGQALATCWDAR